LSVVRVKFVWILWVAFYKFVKKKDGGFQNTVVKVEKISVHGELQ
jgi:hypothetical protein